MAARFRYHPGLDGLRGITVAGVVAYHFGWIRGGFLGVDAFFVLSGFLITSLLVAEREATGRVGLGQFWSRRAKRLLPALVLMVTVVVFFAPGAVERSDVAATLGYVANWRDIWRGASYFDLFSAPSPLRHAWSLAVEEQFYLVWPLVVALVFRLGGRRMLAALCVVGIAASALATALWFNPVDPSRVYYGTDTRAHLLLVGALLALAPRVRIPAWIGASALAGIAALMLTASDHAAFLYQGGMLGHGVLVGLVIATVVTRPHGQLSRTLGAWPLRTLGRGSYGVYLWHWPALVLLTTERTGLTGWQLAVRLGAIAVAATLSFVFVEQPIRSWRAPPRTVLVGSAAAFTIAFMTTAAAIAPPKTINVYATAAESLKDAARIPAPPPPPAAPAKVRATKTIAAVTRQPRKFGVVGDSIASTLAYGLERIAPRHAITVVSASVAGCGVAAGIVLDKEGTPFPWAADCAKAEPNLLNGLIANDNPDVVVWLSTWELADRQLDGRHLEWGTAESDHQLLAAIDQQFRRLTVRGARVVFLAPVPIVQGKLPGVDLPLDRYVHYRELLYKFAAEHEPAASVVDLTPMVCPGGPPCRREVNGVELRPDGAHFSEETAPLVAEQLLPRLLDALRSVPTAGPNGPPR